MSEHLTPLTVAERLFGGIEQVSVVAGRDPKAGYHWRHANSTRLPGDLPSPTVMRALLAHARANGIPLTAEHLLYGAPAEEVDAMIARINREDAA